MNTGEIMTNGEKYYILAENLSYSYFSPDKSEGDAGPRLALDGLTAGIRKGEFMAVIGRNGSGKSTFAKLLSMILEPLDGSLVIDGTKVGPDLSDAEVLELHRKVGMVFQNPDNQLIATVVEEDIAFGPENLGLPPEEIRRRVDSALAAVGLTEYAKAEPSRLSGGQKQRVAIAGVLAMMPECVIFDESTAMLDPVGRRDILKVMKRLSREFGFTVINITHLMDEAAAADRIMVLDGGKLAGIGTPDEIFSDRELMVRTGIQPPFCSRLIDELERRGVLTDCDSEGITRVTPEGCADIIERALSARRRARGS